MIKKEKKWWDITIVKNTQKSGAWLLMCVLTDELGQNEKVLTEAWTNASAAKRGAKEITGRKTFKWIAAGQDDKGKPTQFTCKVEAKNA